MEVLTRVRAGGREIHCGVVTTRKERAAVLAQRFRVYQRRGYHRPGLRVDRDAYDRQAIYFLAVLKDGELGGLLLGSSRLVSAESRARFRFPTEKIFRLELPARFQEIPIDQRAEVSRLVTEAVQGVLIGGFLTPLGLVQAMTAYSKRHGIRLGLSIMRVRFLRALHGAGLPFHELGPAQPIYPENGPLAGYFQQPDPVTPVCWLADELAPAVDRAIEARQRGIEARSPSPPIAPWPASRATIASE